MFSRLFALPLVLLALAAPAWADEPQQQAFPVPPSDKQAAAREARFMSYVLEGDEARAAGKLAAAARAYSNALEVRDDPVVAGRLGVLFVKLNKPADAADLLLEGIERGFGDGVSEEERLSFHRAYNVAFSQVTWLNVTISHAGTKVTLDGKPKNQNGYSGFTLFVMPGEHEIRAQLDGYEDAVFTFTAFKGTERDISLTLKPLRPLLERRETLRPHVRDRIVNVEEPPKDEPEKREIYGGVEGAARWDKPRVTVAAGPVVVFGVASWQPAVGAVAAIGWRPKEYFSLGIEGRAAWLTSGVQGGQINAMTAGALVSACGHWRWFFGCGLGHLGVINVDWQGPTYNPKTDVNVKPGVGGRVGASVRVTRGFVLGASFDALGLNSGVKIVAGPTVVADQPPVMLGVQLAGGWEF